MLPSGLLAPSLEGGQGEGLQCLVFGSLHQFALTRPLVVDAAEVQHTMNNHTIEFLLVSLMKMCRFMMGESLLLLQPCSALLEDVEEFVGCLGAKHGDACLAKVGNAFEHR